MNDDIKSNSNLSLPDLIWREAAGRLAIQELGEDADGQQLSEALRDWWADVHAALGEFIRDPSQSPPTELLMIIRNLADYLRLGLIPGPIADVAKIGRPPIGPEEKRHIQLAAAYVKAAKSGAIRSPHPVESIGRHFRVRRQTVQSWAKQPIPPRIQALIENNPKAFVRAVARAARKYRIAGRSSLAIHRRGIR